MWTEIAGFIKGSAEALDTEKGFLSLQVSAVVCLSTQLISHYFLLTHRNTSLWVAASVPPFPESEVFLFRVSMSLSTCVQRSFTPFSSDTRYFNDRGGGGWCDVPRQGCLHRDRLYDQADLVFHIYSRIKHEQYKGPTIHAFFIGAFFTSIIFFCT